TRRPVPVTPRCLSRAGTPGGPQRPAEWLRSQRAAGNKMGADGHIFFCRPGGGMSVIRFPCQRCGKQLAAQVSRAGAVGTCPECRDPYRVPEEPPAEEGDRHPRQRTARRDEEETLPFSRSGLRKALVWLVCFQLLAFVVMVGSVVGCVVVVLKERVSFQMI